MRNPLDVVLREPPVELRHLPHREAFDVTPGTHLSVALAQVNLHGARFGGFLDGCSCGGLRDWFIVAWCSHDHQSSDMDAGQLWPSV